MGMFFRFKEWLKLHPRFMDGVAFCYNLLHGTYSFSSSVVCQGAFLNKVRFKVVGQGNKIIIGRMARLHDCTISIWGNNCTLHIAGGSTRVAHTSFYFEDDDGCIEIGKDFTMEGGHIAITGGERITIGEDCMFSSDIEIRCGDSHAIIDRQSQQRLNWEQPVCIGDHVWLAAHVRVLKGSVIAAHSIVGSSAVVSGILSQPYSIYAGSPAKQIKSGVDWDRFRHKYTRPHS